MKFRLAWRVMGNTPTGRKAQTIERVAERDDNANKNNNNNNNDNNNSNNNNNNNNAFYYCGSCEVWNYSCLVSVYSWPLLWLKRGETKARYSVFLKQPKSLFLVMLFFISLACVAVRLEAVFLFVAGSYIPNRQCTMLQKKNLRPVSNVALMSCRTQFIDYKYIRIHIIVCLTVSLFLCFVFGNCRSIRLN